ncbi:MAG: fumarylacetoacetate hydrolase family protein [Alsobacter sp.]
MTPTDLAADDMLFALETRSLPVAGTARRFPIRRVFCVGRNYSDHAREMGHDPDREPPFFFMKPAEAVTEPGTRFRYPALSSDVHHEIEMVVALHGGGKDIPVDAALQHVFGYAVGLDMTRRDLQAEAKRLQRPWDSAKAFDGSAPCGPLVRASEIGHPTRGTITLAVNGEIRQSGGIEHMIWSVPEIISVLSTLFELRAGDLLMTGTPAGVGAVRRGDHLRGEIAGIGHLAVDVD